MNSPSTAAPHPKRRIIIPTSSMNSEPTVPLDGSNPALVALEPGYPVIHTEGVKVGFPLGAHE